jgi:hypothetical protein
MVALKSISHSRETPRVIIAGSGVPLGFTMRYSRVGVADTGFIVDGHPQYLNDVNTFFEMVEELK